MLLKYLRIGCEFDKSIELYNMNWIDLDHGDKLHDVDHTFE